MTNPKHIEFLEQAKAHYAADMLIKGTYGEFDGEFRGCSVGCHLHHVKPDLNDFDDVDDKYKIIADYYEYPEWLARLQNTIFEGLPDGESAKWHVQLAEAIVSRNGDINWQETLHRVHIAILRIAYQTAGSAQDAVQRVIDLHERAISGVVSAEDWSAAESAAGYAAGYAAWSAAGSAAWSAAGYAAWSAAESAAGYAAWSAAESAAASAAASAAYQEMRDAVLAILSAKSIVEGQADAFALAERGGEWKPD